MTLTSEETANNIVNETQLIDNSWREAHAVKLELVRLIAQALRAAVAEEREACAHIADEFDSGTEADVGIGIIYNPRDEMARHIAAAIRQRDEMEKTI